jgi:predicted nucleic acid-binding protein
VSLFVLDASVAVKWFLPPGGEPLVKEAWRFLSLHTQGRVRIAVPDLFWPECGNVFWKAARRGRMSIDSANEALHTLMAQNLLTIPSRDLLQHALGIGHAFGHAIYDCVYVALAIRSNAQLVTADEKLANTLAAYLPVKWLGSI